MAIPSWRDELPDRNYIGAGKWGTGVNPVHAVRGGNDKVGRNLAPGAYESGMLHSSGLVETGYEFGYTDEDLELGSDDISWMEAHPNLGAPDSHAQTGMFPQWGNGADPLPNGTKYRALKIGTSVREQEMRVNPYGTVNEGWINKSHGPILDSRTSDPSQYDVTSSMRQRDLAKGNEKAVARDTDDPRHPIQSRIVGMKEKIWSGGKRHEEMLPREQEYGPRPWSYRSAGVGWVYGVNDMYVSEPIKRELPMDVNQGQSEVSDTTEAEWEDFY
jgi:hypothetical protein